MRGQAAPGAPSPAGPRFTAHLGVRATLSILRDHAGTFAVTVLLAQLPVMVLVAVAGGGGPAYAVVKVVTGFVQAALVAAAVETALRGQRPHPAVVSRVVAPRLGALVAISLATSLLTALGLLLLVVPGVVVAAGLYVTTPVALAEPGLGVRGTLERSWALTSGHKVAVLQVALFSLVVLILGSLASWLLLLPLPELPLHGRALLTELLTVPAVVFFAAAPAVVYRQLRAASEPGSASAAG